jgi:hypothetical protein
MIKFPTNAFEGLPKKISLIRFILTFFVWFVIWLLLASERLSGGLEDLLLSSSSEYLHGNSTFLLNTVTMLIVFFVINTYNLTCGYKVSLVLRTVLIIFGLLTGVVTGSKTLALYPLFILILIFSYKNRGIPVTWLSLLFLIVAPIISILNEIRHYGIGGLTEVSDSGTSFGGVFFNAFIERYYGTDIVYAILRAHIEQGKTYYYGESLFSFFYGLIPRALWADKPIISFGKIVSDEYLPDVFHGTGISAAPTIFGELFANFSFASLVLIPFVALLFANHLRSILIKIKQGSSHNLSYFLIAFTTLAFVLEASIVGWVMQLLIIYFATYILSKGCGQS